MRLIDADALRQVLEVFTEKDTLGHTPLQLCDAMPTVHPWHRVEDGLPESGEFGKIVLACNDVGTVNAAFLSSSGKWYAANNTMYDAWTWMPNVTHWMPLPEPPKEE